MPSSWQSQYTPVKARSVPPRRATWYCSGVSWARHSASRLVTFSVAIGGGRSLRGLPDVGHHLPKAALELLLPRSGNEERQAGGPGRGLGVVLEGPSATPSGAPSSLPSRTKSPAG